MATSSTTTAPRRIDIHPVLRDVGLTAAASLANFIAGLLVISIFGHLLGVVLLGEYLLLRRVAAWLQPFTHLGLGVALPRYIAYSKERYPGAEYEYFLAALACIVLLSSGVGIAFFLLQVPLGHVLFGSLHNVYFVRPLFLLMLGVSAQIAVYGYYRGCLSMKRASALQVSAALVPLLSAITLFFTQSVATMVSVSGCTLFVVASAFAIPIFRSLRPAHFQHIHTRAIELLKYSIPRIPGDFSNGALLALGPVVASHFLPITRVSSLLVGLSILSAASVSTEPLGLVFLPKVSMMLAANRLAEVRVYVTHLISACMDVSIFLTTQVIVFADILVHALAGPGLKEEISVIRLVLIGVPFFLFFTALRSVLDAGSARPLNARNLLVALFTLTVLCAASVVLAPRDMLLHCIALSLVLSLGVLAYATRISLVRLFSLQPDWRQSAVPISCAMVLASVALACHGFSELNIIQVAALELVFGSVFFAFCYFSGTSWVQFVWSLVFSSGARTNSVA